MSIVCASVPNWFPDGNLRTKSQIEARWGMLMYIMSI